jgi:transcriptional regulator with XRE-family HTH domain
MELMPMVSSISQKIRGKKLGVLIRDARQESGLSLEDCAARIGLTPAQLEAFESGVESPSLPQLEVFAYNLGIPLDRFWGEKAHAGQQESTADPTVFNRLYVLRSKIIAVILKKSRLEMGVSAQDLAEAVGISTDMLEAYEKGEESIPLPQLEGMAAHLGLPVTYFMDKDGFVGEWASQQRYTQQFQALSPNMQAFVTQPVNEPYLEVAMRLSEMSVEKLRALAEGLLDITL